MADPTDPLEAGLRIAAALDEGGISNALGGALANGLWGVPRATVDVDINVFVTLERLPNVLAALRNLGVDLDDETALRRAEEEGMFVGRYGDFRVDVFVPSIDFSWEAERTRVRHEVEGHEAWFLSAEALAVFKLLFFRAKDVVDLQRLVAVQGDRLDAGYVRRQVAGMMGEDDERVERWDELVATHGP